MPWPSRGSTRGRFSFYRRPFQLCRAGSFGGGFDLRSETMIKTTQLRVYVPEEDLPPVEPIVDLAMVQSMVQPWGMVDLTEPPMRILEWDGDRKSVV